MFYDILDLGCIISKIVYIKVNKKKILRQQFILELMEELQKVNSREDCEIVEESDENDEQNNE